ncbi:MAG: hypothetical protein ACKV2V_24255 [Blastocatellia bacterium]
MDRNSAFLTRWASGRQHGPDALPGKSPWEMRSRDVVVGNPISFLIDGRQHVAIAAGQALFVHRLP